MNAIFLCNNTNPDPKKDWCLKSVDLNYTVLCYRQRLARKEGLWKAENASNSSLPNFLAQLILIISVTRILIFAVRPLRIPRIAAEILGGVLLSVGGVGYTFFGKTYLFPFNSIMTLETVANLGLLYYMFLLGLELDVKPFAQAPKKAVVIAVSGILLTFPIGYALHYMLLENFAAVTKGLPTRHGPLIWGIALSTTNFPDVAQILVDLKLLRSEVGLIALSAAVLTDLSTWLLLIISMVIFNNHLVGTLAAGAVFVVVSLLAFRPALSWVVGLANKRIVDGGSGSGYNDYHMSFVLTLVIAFGYVAEACGYHSILGGFLLGAIMPKGELKEKLMEKVDDFVSRLMMPLFFLIIGLRTNHRSVFAGQFGIGKLVGVLGLAFAAKISSTFLSAVLFNKMKPRDGLALGLLMNTKGVLTLIVISCARDMKVLNIRTFTILLTSLWFMTVAVGPILALTYKPRKHFSEYKRSSVTSLEQQNSEFRILSCFHSSQDVTGIVNLIDASNPTRNSPISIFTLHLIEHVGRASAMIIVHDACRVSAAGDDNDNEQQNSSAVTASIAFNDLKIGKELGALFIHPHTAISSFTTMHEDICSLAEEKQTNLIILPFHLKPTADGGVESTKGNPFRLINKHVLENSPCSVALLVDRGHRPPTILAKIDSQGRPCHHFLVIFIGGPDDREALAYARRMSGNPNIALTVIRFALTNENHADLSTGEEEKQQKLLDAHCIVEFCRETKNNSAVKLKEAAARNVVELFEAIRDLDGYDFDLIIVGKGKERELPITGNLSEWSEFPEFGPLGDTLVCSNFAVNAWILVVQRCGGCDRSSSSIGNDDDDNDDDDDGVNGCSTASDPRGENSGPMSEPLDSKTWGPDQFQKPDLATFFSRGTKSF